MPTRRVREQAAQVVLVESADDNQPQLVVTVTTWNGPRSVVLTADQARSVAYQMRLLLDQRKARALRQPAPTSSETNELR